MLIKWNLLRNETYVRCKLSSIWRGLIQQIDMHVMLVNSTRYIPQQTGIMKYSTENTIIVQGVSWFTIIQHYLVLWKQLLASYVTSWSGEFCDHGTNHQPQKMVIAPLLVHKRKSIKSRIYINYWQDIIIIAQNHRLWSNNSMSLSS